MRDIIISKYPSPDEFKYPRPDGDTSVWLTCEGYKELDRYYKLAQRMRPDRIIVNYGEYQ